MVSFDDINVCFVRFSLFDILAFFAPTTTTTSNCAAVGMSLTAGAAECCTCCVF